MLIRLPDLRIHTIARQLEDLGARHADVADYLHFAAGQKNPAMTPERRRNIERDIGYILALRLKRRIDWRQDKNTNEWFLIDSKSGCIINGLDEKPIPPTARPPDQLFSAVDEKAARAFTAENEGRIPHMYLDIEGLVTIGVGFFIADEAEAKKLPLKTKGTPTRDATAQEKVDEFRRIKALKGSPLVDLDDEGAEQFEPFTKLKMELGEIDNLFSAKFAEKKKGANGLFTLTTMPPMMQMAFIDLIYQRGPGKGRTTGKPFKDDYPKFTAAINRGDWAEAGAQADVNVPPTPVRNDKRKALGLAAALEWPFKVPAGRKSKPLPEILAEF